MSKKLLQKTAFTSLLCLCFHIAFAQINWQKDSSLNVGLPMGIEVYRGSGFINGSANIKAVYTVFDPALNPQLELDVAMGNNVLRTPQQFSALETEKVWVTTNGGFFGGTATNSLVIQNGVVLGNNIKTVVRGANTYYPTRAAIGLTFSGTSSVNWMYNVGTTNIPYTYPNAAANNVTLPPLAQPSATFPTGGSIWNAYTAMGGGPMLLKNGVRIITDTAELFDAASGVDPSGRAPRTAIGYTASGKYYLLVVDGRTAANPGANMNTLADIFQSLGCNNAINLDGGGSTAMVVNNAVANSPSDATGVRPVSSVIFIKQKNWIYDTEFPLTYKEIGGAWSETSNTGFFGPSRARFVNSGDGSRKAYYILNNLPPAAYRLSAWWVAAANRSNNTPFIIRRASFAADTVRMNQSINGSRWNTIGTYQLSAGDTVEINNAGQPGALVTSDAIQLVKTAESAPVYFLQNGNYGEHVKDSVIAFNVKLTSINSGVKLNKLIVRKILNNTQIQLDSLQFASVDSLSYNVNTTAAEAIGNIVKIKFSATDNLNRIFDTVYTYKVTPITQIRFIPDSISRNIEKGKPFTLRATFDTRTAATTLKNFRIYKSINNGTRILYDSLLNIGGQIRNYIRQDTTRENVRDIIKFDFELTDSNNDTATKTLTATVIPGRGNFRIAVISDLNGACGEAFYEWQVDSIMQRIPRLWQPNLVVSGGDLIAGQCSNYDSAGVAAMWAGFDAKIAKPLRDNNIPHAFTMGNHDAAAGFNLDRTGAKIYWRKPTSFPGWFPVDTTNYPYYHSFMERANGDYFFVSWEASDANLSQADIDWTLQQFQRPEAQNAKYKILIGHMPFYGVAQERDGAGNILNNGDALRKRMEDAGVRVYVSGHHHAYYPGRRGKIDLLNTGAAGSGARKWTFNDETAPNTVTLIDFFEAQDSLVYTTYEIKEQSAANMKIFNEGRMPKAVFGVNGFTHNRSLVVKAAADGNFSRFNVPDSLLSPAIGNVIFTASGTNVKVSGSFNNLKGKLLKTNDAIAVYKAVFPKEGELIKGLKVKSTDGKNGTFEGTIKVDDRKELLELISVGAMYVAAKTDSFFNGEIRAQLFQSDNVALSKAVINSQSADSVYDIRNIPAFFKISWSKSTDKDIDAATYTYQLATDSLFNNIIFNKYNGVATSVGRTQTQLWQLMASDSLFVEKKFYQRIISSDGSHVTYGDATALRLKKTNAAPVGNILLQAPDYKYECAAQDGDGNCIESFANSSAGHGLVVDNAGRLWYHPFSGGVTVRNADRSFYQLTSPNLRFALPSAPTTLLAAWQPGAFIKQITLNNTNYTINLNTGMGLAADGNILLSSASALIKLNAITGEPMRYVQLGSLGLSNPTADSIGRVFLTRVLNNQSFILKESIIRSTGYDTVLSQFALPLYPGVTRGSAMAFDGRSIYLPAATETYVNRYVSADGLNFVFDRRINLQGTCNSVHVKPGNKVYIVSNRTGNIPPILEYLDYSDTTKITSWSFPLADIAAEASDLRGVTLNIQADTFYVNSLGSFKVYKYHIPAAGNNNSTTPSSAPLYKIKDVKGVKVSTGIADSLGVYCTLFGTVQNDNNFASNNGYDFVINDTTAGIQVFNLKPTAFVNINRGDSITVKGFIRQFAGLTRIVPDTLIKIASNKALQKPILVDSLIEKNESATISISPLLLATTTDWTATGNYLGNTLKTFKGADSLEITVPNTSNILNYNLPRGEFAVRGIESQFKEQSAYFGGYYLQPRDTADIAFTNTVVINGVRFCSADSVNIQFIKAGKFDSSNQFRLQISDKDGSFATAFFDQQITAQLNRLKIVAPQIAGSKYRIRLLSTAPLLKGGDNGNDIEIVLTPAVIIVRNAAVMEATGALQYQWYFNGNAVAAPDGQQPQLTIKNAGDYYVTGTSNGCAATSNKINIKLEDVFNGRFNNLLVTPNPIKDNMRIRFNDSYIGNIEVVIFDAAGKQILVKQFNKQTAFADFSLPLQSIQSGMLVIRIKTDIIKTVNVVKQ